MLLERLDDHGDDVFCRGRVHICTDSHHDNLHEAAQDELNVHDFCDALVRILDCHLELGQDHKKHGLQAGVALQARRLAQTRQGCIAGLHQAIACIVVGDTGGIAEKPLGYGLEVWSKLILLLFRRVWCE